jgi:hypothetical protein
MNLHTQAYIIHIYEKINLKKKRKVVISLKPFEVPRLLPNGEGSSPFQNPSISSI